MKRTSNQTKPEGFSQDDKKKVKATDLENFEKIEEEMFTDFGKFGRCNAPKHINCPQRFDPIFFKMFHSSSFLQISGRNSRTIRQSFVQRLCD